MQRSPGQHQNRRGQNGYSEPQSGTIGDGEQSGTIGDRKQSGTANTRHTTGSSHRQEDAGPQQHRQSQTNGGGSGPQQHRQSQTNGGARVDTEDPSRTGTGVSGDESGDAGSVTILRVIAGLFGLFGAVSLYAGLESLYLSTETPVGASRLQTMGLVAVGVGVAYVYAAYGVWRLRKRGWQVGMGLVGVGTLLTLLALLSSGALGALVGLALNCALAWGLHTNRGPFRDQRHGKTEAAMSTQQTAAHTRQTAGGGGDGYASERRGRH
jgi:hypothetical protein